MVDAKIGLLCDITDYRFSFIRTVIIIFGRKYFNHIIYETLQINTNKKFLEITYHFGIETKKTIR